MRKVDENRAENYIRKHKRYKKWLAFVLCLSLLTGTITLYMLNKPAIAMTEDGAKAVGAVLETNDSDFEQELIEQTINDDEEEPEEESASEESSQEESDGEDAEESADQAGEGSSEETDSEEETEESGEEATEGTSGEEETEEATEGTSGEEGTEEKSGEEETEEATEGKSSEEETDEVSEETTGEETDKSSDEATEGETTDEEITEEEKDKDSEEEKSDDETSEEEKDEKSSDKKEKDKEESEEEEDGKDSKSKKGDKEEEEEDELTEDVVITVSYVDEDGQVLKDDKEISISDSISFADEAPSIEGYEFKEATIDGDVITALSVKKNDDDIRYYEATFSDDSTEEIKEDKTVVLTYTLLEEEEAEEIVITASYVDEDGESISEDQTLEIKDSITFEDDAAEIEGYQFKKATIDDSVVTKIAVVKSDDAEEASEASEDDEKEDAADAAVYYEATLEDGSTIEIKEDKTVVLTYAVSETKSSVVLTALYVDKAGEEIAESKALNLGKETEVSKLEPEEIDGYFYQGLFYEENEIVKITPVFEEDEDKKSDDKDSESDKADEKSEDTPDSDEESKLITGYKLETSDGESVELSEDAEVKFTFVKASQETEFTYSDKKVNIKVVTNKKNVFPEGVELKGTEVTKETEKYNYDAYMEALNDNAEAIAKDAGQDVATTYDDSNTLMYDIAFMYEGKEIQPAEGAVSISLEFKNKQLTNDLSVVSEEDVTVVHMPIKEEVKEQSEISSTSEATDITAGDIEVKTLTDATTELNNVEKVEFSEDNFSVFVFVSGTTQKNTWNGSKNITLNDFSGISSLFNYSIVSNSLESYGHIEGNVRTGTFYTSSDASIFNAGGNRISQNPITEINVVKNVVNGSDGTFNFGFYNSNNMPIGCNFSITTQNKTGTKKILNTDNTFSSVFTALNNGTTLYVYELDANDNIVKEGEKYKDYTVSYTYTDILGYDSEEIANDHDSNYIGEFQSVYGGTIEVGNNFFGTSENYVGESWGTKSGKPSNYYYFGYDQDFGVQNATDDMFTYVDKLKATIGSDIEAAKKVSVALADSKNYASGNNTTSNLVNVLNLVSTTGTLSSDLTAANLASPYISGLISSDQYLLINIAVGSDTYNIDGQGIYFDNLNPQNGYSPLASHIIYNFVNADRTASYAGTVKITSWSDGLLLAPSATVDQTGGYFQGEIIGNYVKHGNGNELHKKTITSGKAVTVNILNTADGGLVVYKQVNGKPAIASYDGKFGFIVERYDGNGRWTNITGQINTDGITNQYDSASGLSMIAIPLPNLKKGKTAYFRIHEDASRTVSGLTNDTSYIYAKVDVSPTGSVSSIRYYKVRGDYSDLSSPYNAIDKSGASEVVGSEVAFNNTTTRTSLVVTKNWVGGYEWKYVYAYVCGRAGSEDVNGKVIQLSEDNNWTVAIKDLPAYTDNGTPIVYRVVEIGQVVNSIEEIQYDDNGRPSNLLYDKNAANTQSAEYEGYTASYETDLSEGNIISALGTTSVTAPERVGAAGELSGTVTITNTYNYENVTLSLFKYLDGKDPDGVTFEFEISVLKNNGKELDILGTVTNIGNSISYTTEIKNKYFITKSGGEKNVYFLIKEKDVSSNQFTKDDNYIIAKVKKLGQKDQTVYYYRVSNSSEKTNIDNDASKIVTYANDPHRINNIADVAFYNTSYSITVKKEWYDSDGNALSKGDYDDYTPVNIIVWRKGNGLAPAVYETVTLSKANNWEYTLNNVPRRWNSNQQYVYYIQECDNYGNPITDSAFVGYYKIVDGNASSITNQYDGVDIRGNEDNGTLVLVCCNTRSGMILPKTGGNGTIPYIVVGLAFIALACLGFVLAGRKQRF